MNDKGKHDIPENFDPNEYGEYLTKLGKMEMDFLDKEEQQAISLMRKNYRELEKAGLRFDDEKKLGYITHFSMMESEKLWHEFAVNGIKSAVGAITTILSIMYKGIFEKIEAEDAVFGPRKDGTK